MGLSGFIAKENRLEHFNALETYAVEGDFVPFADMIAELINRQLTGGFK